VRLGGSDQGWLGRPALARGALALRRHRPRRPAGLRAGLRRPPAHCPRRSGKEADRGAGGSGPGQPAVRGRRARTRRPSPRRRSMKSSSTRATARRWRRSPACRN
jgi:hypothetical protein